jgi:hypothetical protein
LRFREESFTIDSEYTGGEKRSWVVNEVNRVLDKTSTCGIFQRFAVPEESPTPDVGFVGRVHVAPDRTARVLCTFQMKAGRSSIDWADVCNEAKKMLSVEGGKQSEVSREESEFVFEVFFVLACTLGPEMSQVLDEEGQVLEGSDDVREGSDGKVLIFDWGEYASKRVSEGQGSLIVCLPSSPDAADTPVAPQWRPRKYTSQGDADRDSPRLSGSVSTRILEVPRNSKVIVAGESWLQWMLGKELVELLCNVKESDG